MANINYTDLLDEVLPFLAADPGKPVTVSAIKRTVIEFCNGSWIWQYLPDPLNVIAGVNTYDLEPPTGANVTAVIDVVHGTESLQNRSLNWLDQNTAGWRTVRRTPKFFTQVDTTQIILAPVPDITIRGGLLMTLALQPTVSSDSFPDWIYNQFVYEIANGAIARLMLMPARPWTDLANGADRRTKFEQSIANARTKAVFALGRAIERVKPQH